jgi:hypothetical protein
LLVQRSHQSVHSDQLLLMLQPLLFLGDLLIGYY